MSLYENKGQGLLEVGISSSIPKKAVEGPKGEVGIFGRGLKYPLFILNDWTTLPTAHPHLRKIPHHLNKDEDRGRTVRLMESIGLIV